jgi:hypothetical protein
LRPFASALRQVRETLLDAARYPADKLPQLRPGIKGLTGGFLPACEEGIEE